MPSRAQSKENPGQAAVQKKRTLPEPNGRGEDVGIIAEYLSSEGKGSGANTIAKTGGGANRLKAIKRQMYGLGRFGTFESASGAVGCLESSLTLHR
jgi:hypothetical protein